ncbi:MAG: hypothetical protein AB1458_05135 [Bacteroidota bacterium]
MDPLVLDEELATDPLAPRRRPVFVTVLCILTFIGCAGYIGLFSFIYYEEGLNEYNYTSVFKEHLRMFCIIQVVCALVCALGALLMLLKKKAGFIIYLAGQLSPVIYGSIYRRELRIRDWDEMLLVLGPPFIFMVLFSLSYRFINAGLAVRQENQRERPVFLVVLCILSFIGSMLHIVLFLFIRSFYERYLDYGSFLPYYEESASFFLFVVNYCWLNIACSLLSAAGAAIMLLRRSFGFYIYLFAQVIPVLVGLFFYLAKYAHNLESIHAFFMAMLLGIPLVFVFMYRLNFRHLR